MAAQVRIRVCSVLTVETADRVLVGHDIGSRKARTLLAFLVSQRGRVVPLDRVADIVWPAGAPADPAANVATLVSRMRRILGEGVLVASGRVYGVVADACTVDLDEAKALVVEGLSRLAAGEPALAAAAARRALHLLGSQPALPDESDVDWVFHVRRDVDELRRKARHVLSEATTSTGPAEALEAASDAVAADPYDERAVRDVMRARVADGSVAAALSAYDELAGRLREDLGIDPAAATAQLHLAILRGERLPPEDAERRRRPQRATLVGREAELAALDRLWVDAGGGVGHLLLVQGVGGIGKTRLLDACADLADSSGGLVLRARCHRAERSLFLQPYVDALRPVLLGVGVVELADLVREHTAPWVSLVPDLVELVGMRPEPAAAPTIERRRAYDAVVAVLGRLARRRPVLLTVDDLQDGGAASVDLLGYLAGRLAGAGVLLVGAVRTEDAATVARLADRAIQVQLDALPPAAVQALAAEAGLSAHASEVLARTAGHSLSVVEYLRALAAGDAGVPESLAAAVQARVDRLQPPERELVQGASVLDGLLDPRLLAELLVDDELSVVRLCEELARVGLFDRVGPRYEFVNDLTQESVYLSLAPSLVAAYHRRAADLLSDQPESMAAHAFASGEHGRAAQGWLLAGQAAMGRSAVEDAIDLFDRSLEAAGDDVPLRARVLLARGRANEASTAYAAALADIDAALTLARAGSDKRLEMAALRARGGDVPVALRVPASSVAFHLEAGLQLASSLGDRSAEADFTARLTVLEASRLRLATALDRAEAGLARARASSSEEAVALALDGVKTVLGYLGESDRLRDVVAELTPKLRERRSTFLLQWAVFESSFAAAADDNWDEARALVDEALEVNRSSGFKAYAGYFRAHLGWYERLAGNLDAAIARGRTAVAETSPVDHPWWYATAAGLLAGTLLEFGATSEAEALAARGLALTGPHAPEAWRLRCLAPLAATGGSAGESAYNEAHRIIEAIECPPGKAWVIGADCYLLVAGAAQRRDDHEAATRVLTPLHRAVDRSWDSVRARVESQLGA